MLNLSPEVTPSSDAVLKPTCSICHAAMKLVCIEPKSPGHEIRTFKCTECKRLANVVVKFASAAGALCRQG
jgi:hypothetical protein